MKSFLRPALAIAAFAAVALASADRASARDAHADGSSTTQAGACKMAMALARQGIPKDRVASSHCECLENPEDVAARWSCQAFVTYQ